MGIRSHLEHFKFALLNELKRHIQDDTYSYLAMFHDPACRGIYRTIENVVSEIICEKHLRLRESCAISGVSLGTMSINALKIDVLDLGAVPSSSTIFALLRSANLMGLK